MVEVRLFGKLMRYANNEHEASPAVVSVDAAAGVSIQGILDRLGISKDEVSNIFLNGRLADASQEIVGGDRLGLFPIDMGLLYCWKAAILVVEVRLYGKLRRLAPDSRANADSILHLEYRAGETIGQLLGRLGIAPAETSNIFMNAELSGLTRPVADGGRLGIFPDDMGLLYSWYFEKKG